MTSSVLLQLRQHCLDTIGYAQLAQKLGWSRAGLDDFFKSSYASLEQVYKVAFHLDCQLCIALTNPKTGEETVIET